VIHVPRVGVRGCTSTTAGITFATDDPRTRRQKLFSRDDGERVERCRPHVGAYSDLFGEVLPLQAEVCHFFFLRGVAGLLVTDTRIDVGGGKIGASHR